MTQLAAESQTFCTGDGMPNLPSRLIVTIDGPAGTGKSSVSREVAARLGVDFLDTGAMYRAAAALAIDAGLATSDVHAIEARIARVVHEADLRFDFSADPPTLIAGSASIMHRLRDGDVAALVSPVSELAQIRQILVSRQRRIAETHRRLVTEGRDQGSVVFPQADVMIYLDASLEIRAQRRAQQLTLSGRPASLAEIARDIAQRDQRDSTRAVGPLVCPVGAVRLDTSDLTRDEVVGRLVSIVIERLATARADS